MTITGITVRDIRFPTARQQDGSDALYAGDYSAACVVLQTDAGLDGHGLTLTNGRGNEIVVAAAHALEHHVLGRRLDDVAVSGSLQDRVCEYVDHLHDYFVDPCVTKNARYLAPLSPGFSIAIEPQSLTDYAFPHGRVWAGHAG